MAMKKKLMAKPMKSDNDGDEVKLPNRHSKPKGPQGRAAVKQLGRTYTTGNFSAIQKAKGTGAAVAAFQNAKKAYKAKKK